MPASDSATGEPPEVGKVSRTVRDASPPENVLDLIDRILIRATDTPAKWIMHLTLLAVFFAGLGLIAHIAVGISPWLAAGGSIGGGAVAGTVAHRRIVKASKAAGVSPAPAGGDPGQQGPAGDTTDAGDDGC